MADYGLLKVRLSDGRNIKVRGSVTEIISGVSAEAIVNHDGSIDRSFTARAYEFSVSLAARDESGVPVDAEALIRAAPQDVSLLADAEKSATIFSRAVFVGEPSVDKVTGELSGLMIRAEGRLVTNV